MLEQVNGGHAQDLHHRPERSGTVTDWQGRVVVAAAVLAAGLLVAVAARVVVGRLLRQVLPGRDGPASQARAAARGVFWFLVVAAVLVSVSLLAPDLLAEVPAQVLRFLPRLGVALLIVWLGALAASLLGHLVATSLRGVGASGAGALGRLAYWTVLGLAILMAADQLGVQTQVLQALLYILLVVVGTAAALAVGLGGRALAGNVIAGRYVDDRFTVGEEIEVDAYKGTIVEVGLASVTIADTDGRLVEIPHTYLLDRPVRRSGV
jgi:small-conductance mechanosensitive channel